MDTEGLIPNNSDHFDVWYTPGAFVYNEKQGKFEINKDFVAMTDESGSMVFSLRRNNIQSIHVTFSKQLVIKAADKQYVLSFMDVKKAAVKQQAFGMWSWGRKNSFFSSENEKYCELAVQSLESKQYVVSQNPPISTKKGIVIMLALFGGFVLLCIIIWILFY